MSKRLKFGSESREKLIEGINLVADAVSVTMGAMGRNVVMKRVGQAPHVTKDGYSVAKEIFNSEPEVDMGAQMMKGVSAKTVEDTGDGTTTATVLAQTMIEEGVKHLDRGANPIDLKRGIDQAVHAVVASLDDLATPISTKEQIKTKYRELTLKFHPDKNKSKNTTVKMTEINRAYEIIMGAVVQ